MQNKKLVTVLVVTVLVLAVALIVFISLFVQAKKIQDERQSQVASSTVVSSANSPAPTGTVTTVTKVDGGERITVAPVGSSLLLVSPLGGETECLGKPMTIKWQSAGYDEVFIQFTNENGFYDIGRFPANFNEGNTPGYGEVSWVIASSTYDYPYGGQRVNTPIGESYGNMISVTGYVIGSGIANSVTSKPFTTVICSD